MSILNGENNMYNFDKSQEKQIIIDYEGNYSLKKIAEKYQVDREAIKRILKKNNVHFRKRTKKYTNNSFYFDKIDREDKAYFLGFIYADGCVHKSTKYNSYSLRIAIVEKDKEIISDFKKNIQSNHKIYHHDRRSFGWQDQVSICINDNHLCNSLINSGCTERKSTTCSFPSCVPNHLLSHFIRGYFDGDGSICATSHYIYPVVRMCATHSFASKIKEIIYKKLKINTNIIYKKSAIYDSEYSKKRAMIFLDWMYNNSTFYLKRKYNRYLFFKKYYQNSKGGLNRKIREIEWNKIKNNY